MRKTTLAAIAFAASLACGGPPTARGPGAAVGVPGQAPAASAPVVPGPPLVPSPESAIFAAHLARNGDMTYEQLRGRIKERSYRTALSFDPTDARYYDTVARALQLTPREIATFKTHGVVSVDHHQRYSMGSAYYAIYAKDLPVFITTDSILHALHRSYDKVLQSLEATVLVPTLEKALAIAHDTLAAELSQAKDPALLQSLGDVDLFLTSHGACSRETTKGAQQRSREPGTTIRSARCCPASPPSSWNPWSCTVGNARLTSHSSSRAVTTTNHPSCSPTSKP